MKFYSIDVKAPIHGSIVLIKTNISDCPYYVCRVCYSKKTNEWRFVEAYGEEYFDFPFNQVIGWMPIEELNNIQLI